MTRFFLSIGRDVRKQKMCLTLLLTTRGIPQIYYGTELLMDGDGGHHPNVRKDFPGGWAGDKANGFTAAGRTRDQNDVYDYIKKLLSWRKSQPVIHNGKLLHFIPQDNVYVYFRHDATTTVMVVLNASDSEKTLDVARFDEILISFKSAKDVITNQEWNSFSDIRMLPWTATIFELE